MNQQAWKQYEALPLPTRRDLDWQHFDLRGLKLDNIAQRARPVAAKLTGAVPTGVVFGDLARHRDVANRFLGQALNGAGRHKFTLLHEALWENGALLYVPRNVRVSEPLTITYDLPNHDSAAFPRTLIVLEPGAEATLVQRFTGAPGVHASGTEVFVQPGARLHYISLQNFAPTAYDFTVKRAHVAQDAEVDWVIGMFGGLFARYDIECVMEGRGGHSFMYGVGLGENRQQLGQFTRQHHRVGDTTSDLLFKNVLRDDAVSNYTGLIKVEKNSNGTNAYQSNRNLVLSDKVQCDTRPILEIESNQLRCTHGATVGRLDENQLFYLRSRGLTLAQARQALIEAFLEPILARIQVESVREEFSRLIHAKVLR